MNSRLLILGGGGVTQEFYLPALESLGLLQQTVVVDPHVEPDSLQKTFSGLRVWREDLETLKGRAPSDLKFDAAVVALPNHLHEGAVEWAIGQGWDVLCEKPLALHSVVCQRLASLAGQAGKRLAVNMIRRQFPSFQLAQKMISDGAIGPLRRIAMIHGSQYAWPARSLAPFDPTNGGVLADMGVHYLDLAGSFLGELTPVSYEDDWQGGVEADVRFNLVSAQSVELVVALSRRRNLQNGVVFEGSKGSIDVGVDDLAGLLWKRGDTTVRVGALASPEPTFVSCFANQLKLFLDDAELPVSGSGAARTMALIEWAYAGRKRTCSVSDMRPVCVTGGTGFIGGKLVERLVRLGAKDILVPVRGPANCANVARFPVRLRQFDLLDAASVRDAVKGRGWVFHLAYGRDGANQQLATIQGTQNVVDAAIEAGCDGVVVLSSMAVIGLPKGDADESFPYRPAYGDYGKSKATMEQWCLARARSSGRTKIVVLNPSCVYGPNGATYTELPAVLAKKGEFCWIDEGTGNANYVYIENLLDAILLATTVPEAHGQRFLINDGTTSWKQFLQPLLKPWLNQIPTYSVGQLAEFTRQSRPRGSLVRAFRAALRDRDVRTELKALPVTQWMRKLIPPQVIEATGQRSKRTPVVKAPPSVPPFWLVELFGPCGTAIVSKKAERMLGWRPRVSLEEGQKDCRAYLDWKGIS